MHAPHSTPASATLPQPKPSPHHAQAYLTVHLGGRAYGIAHRRVRAVYRRSDVKPTPELPDWFLGALYPAGRLVPVVNLRRRFVVPGDAPEESSVVVAQVYVPGYPSLPLGFLVDALGRVERATASDVTLHSPSPPGGRGSVPLPCQPHALWRVPHVLDLERLIAPALMAHLPARFDPGHGWPGEPAEPALLRPSLREA